jgi:alpha-glucosidase
MIILVNNRDEERDAEIFVWQTGITRLEESTLTRVMLTHKDGFTIEPETIIAKAGVITAHMPAFSVTLFHHKNE